MFVLIPRVDPRNILASAERERRRGWKRRDRASKKKGRKKREKERTNEKKGGKRNGRKNTVNGN